MYSTGCSGNRRSLSGREARVLTEKTARVKQTRFFSYNNYSVPVCTEAATLLTTKHRYINSRE
ncbi:hypothetical protein LG35_03345 [Alistipes inops]|uniref:Uncharacterized protein n=1 Tax=Alistipes inops TaxID=1501391 RepID=A0ABR4YK64_9BACT|nr:hypothetical protein LG35_03345 [Alistipes inops]